VVIIPNVQTKCGNGFGDFPRVALIDISDEGLVDLDLIEREAAEIAERRVSGSEIVHCNFDAQIAKFVQDPKIVAASVGQHRLGDFEFQPLPLGRSTERPRGPDEGSRREALAGGNAIKVKVSKHLSQSLEAGG